MTQRESSPFHRRYFWQFFFILLPAMAVAGGPLSIVIQQPAAWRADLDDVRKVLHSAAAPLWAQFPDRDLSPIHVHPRGGPIVYHKRGRAGEYTIKLNTGGTYWAQYAYQFSHEFGHILCNYRDGKNPNNWFEEAICELASLYALRQMATTWKTRPPYPNWRNFHHALDHYAQNLIDKTKVPDDLSNWYKQHNDHLRKTDDDRPLNRVVAVALLPQFEAKPELWQSVAALNAVRDRDIPFRDYLDAWRQNAPAKFSADIQAIEARFGF